MNEKTKLTFRICLNFGILISIAFILASYIFFQRGTSILINPELTNINYILCISGLYFAIRTIRKDLLNNITYWEAVLSGLVITTIAAIPFAIYTYLIIASEPNMIADTIGIMEKVIKDYNYTIEQNKSIMSFYTIIATPVFMTFMQFINKILMGLFFSLVLSSFLSRRKYLGVK